MNLGATQVLTIHGCQGQIRCLERVERHKSKPLGLAIVWIAHDATRQDATKGTKRVVQHFVVDFCVKTADK